MTATPKLPKHAVRNADRRSTTLWLEDEHCPDGEYDVRGGLCWPIPTPEGGVRGFAVVVGRHVPSGVYHWLDESPWVCVEHVVENGRITFPGVAQWFNEAWRKFYVHQWYFKGDRDLAWRYRKQIAKSDQVQPKPRISEVDWANDAYPISVMRELRDSERLSGPKESEVFRTELTWATTPDGTDMPPQIQAICAVLVGMEQWTMDAARKNP